MDLTTADLVWNRACNTELRAGRPGDVHLWALLRVHNLVMSGGTTFAKEVLDPSAFPAAVEACRYFDLSELADLIGRIAVMVDDDELNMDDEYGELVPLDQVLVDAFERRYETAPGDFDRVDMTP